MANKDVVVVDKLSELDWLVEVLDDATKHTERQLFTHRVVEALSTHSGFYPIPDGIKCRGCDWTSSGSNRNRQYRKHQGWAVAEEFGWPEY